MAASAASDFRRLNEDIIAALDVVAEYAALGVQFTSRKEPSASGFVQCHAIGREDKNPSAAVNVKTGVYVDLGNGHEACGLFDFAVRRGAFVDWKEARRAFAKKAGLAKRLPKNEQDRPEDKIELSRQWNPFAIRGLTTAYPGITEKALQLAGARIAKYPAKSPQPRYVVALPCFGVSLLNEPPRAWVLQAGDGGLIELYQGQGNPTRPEKRITIGQSGLIGRHALQRIQESDGGKGIERVWKVEGVSDFLTLQAAIPDELKDTHLVLTNAAGAKEVSLPSEVGVIFTGLKVCIVHDCDEPGQDGVKNWRGAIGRYCKSCTNVVLPFEMSENKGKDLRDWLMSGKTYADLVSLAEEAERASQGEPTASSENSSAPIDGNAKPEKKDDSLTTHQYILKRLGAIVLGHYEGTETIVAFAVKSGKVFEIRSIQHYGLETLLLHLGEEVEPMICTSGEPGPGQFTMANVKRAFAIEGGKKRITDQNSLGVGVWETSGRLLLVGAGEAAIWNSHLVRTSVPAIEGRICDFGTSEPWYEWEWLQAAIKESESPDWCRAVLNESCELFRRWDNWVHEDTPELITALICCTWLQSVWPWRPQVAVAGPSNSGKSMFLEETLRHIFGPLNLFCAQATEAGLRHQVRNTSKIIIIDEFEHDEHRSKILKLFRTSSRGANIIRGTSDQKGAMFHLKHIPWVGAIETGMNRAADRNRYIMLELRKVSTGAGGKLKVPPPAELRELGLKLLVVAMRHWKAAGTLAEGLRADSFDGVDHRVVESYSVPVSILASVLGMDHPAARELLRGIFSSRDFSSQQESDEELLLKDIYESSIQLEGGKRLTVSELLSNADIVSADREKHLRRCGIKVLRGEDRIFFVKSAINRELLQGSDFKGANLDEIMLRVKGATRCRQRMGDHFPRGISVPTDSIQKILGLDERQREENGIDEETDREERGVF